VNSGTADSRTMGRSILAIFWSGESGVSMDLVMSCSFSESPGLKFPFGGMVRSSVAYQVIQGMPPALNHLPTLPPSSTPPGSPFTSFSPLTSCVEPPWLKRTMRSPRCRDLVQSGTFEVLCRPDRQSLNENSFKDTRTFFQPTETDDIHLNISAIEKKSKGERDIDERRNKSPDVTTIIVRPLPFAPATHSTQTLARRLCFSLSVQPWSSHSTYPWSPNLTLEPKPSFRQYSSLSVQAKALPFHLPRKLLPTGSRPPSSSLERVSWSQYSPRGS